ncbi:MAG TPA: cation:proton antiporter [Flavobacteriales bacterium]|nr:cation:proton antiporter [Flavobacteriales bacterium]HPH81751.1 cation:proton antiporter [Flavobacteriales bacterium]
MRRSFLFYVSIISGAAAAIWYVVKSGKTLESGRPIQSLPKVAAEDLFQNGLDTFLANIHHPLAILILQIISIIFVARIFGLIFTRIGQPSVIGEITAGIVLGPSLLGMYFPEYSLFLFPVESLGNLQFLSQVGLILFMFVIGMELDLSVLKNKAHEAVVISHASIVIPYTLGMGLAYYIYSEYAPPTVPFLSFGLFMGIAMSITAFPVLARIIQERGLTRTKLGAIAITSAAADDITAWCILAAVIAIVKAGSFMSALFTIGFSLVYVVVMVYLIGPFLKRLGSIYSNRETISKGIVALVFIILLASAYSTEIIGIHALFGAFLAGVIMPPNLNFRKILIDKIEDVSLVLLLPLFFVLTGLRTQIGLLNEQHLWFVCGLVICVAVAGKFVGSALAAKIIGQSWKDSLSIGALMNTRGLMELIVLNIGYDLGILTPTVFAMMVIMALVTTFMTGPSLSFINWIFKEKYVQPEIIPVKKEVPALKVLISFGLASSGRKILRLATQLYGTDSKSVHYSAVHVTPSADVSLINVSEFEQQSFRPIRAEAEKMKIELESHYKLSTDLHKEVTSMIEKEEINLLLIGAGKSLYTGSLLGNIVGVAKTLSPENLIGTITGANPLFRTDYLIDDKARYFIEQSSCDVGVLIDRDFSDAGTLFLPLFGEEDAFMLNYARKFILNSKSDVSVMDSFEQLAGDSVIREKFNRLKSEFPDRIKLLQVKTIGKEFLLQQELMLISYPSWKGLVDSKSLWLEHVPSVLILRSRLQ